MRLSLLALTASLSLLFSPPANAEIERTDLSVMSDPGITIGLRKVVDTSATPTGDPVVLLHGARVPGIPSFDLPVENGSLAADLARAGLQTYIVDLRGYGMSTRPPAMNQPRTISEPLVRSGTAVRDLSAAVEEVLRDSEAEKVALLGWATGGHWAGLYATLSPEKVSRVVYYNTLYGGTPEHQAIGAGSRLSDPNRPDQFNLTLFQNYRFSSGDSLLGGWTRSIPIDDKAAWRDPAVAKAYVVQALASDPTSETRDPASFRAPSGALIDSFLIATGASLWDARLTTADALIIRSGRDFWAREADVSRLEAHLSQRREGEVSALTIPDATHFVHLDRPERGRSAFLGAVVDFLAKP